MRILAIESSADETGVAVVEKSENEQSAQVISNVISSSLSIHAKTGGIIPENAAREQVRLMIPTLIGGLLQSESINLKNDISKNYQTANEILSDRIDAIAVTCGPGLIGSLLVGVETAKTLSYVFKKPIIPVNHLLAHLYANFIKTSNFGKISFPLIGLIVSGGHTDLLYAPDHGKFEWLGGTRDDAAGEAFDKTGRLLGISYPAGPQIEMRAAMVKENDINFKSPLLHSQDLDFSFSGLKTEVLRFVQKNEVVTEETKNKICAALQKAVNDVLVAKTLKAAYEKKVSTIIVGGGVSANRALKNQFENELKKNNKKFTVHFPEPEFSTDNGAAIGAYALFNYHPSPVLKITANPNLYFSKK